jgi:hypothetical protein
MNGKNTLKKRKRLIVLTIVMVSTLLLAVFAYRVAFMRTGHIATAGQTQLATAPAKQSLPLTPTATTPAVLPLLSGPVLGVDGDPKLNYPGIPWVRLGYPTCGWGNLTGQVLKNTIQQYHKQSVRVMLSICQPSRNPDVLLNPQPLKGARTLIMTCGSRRVTVVNQEQLLADMYSGCVLPGN